MARYKIFIISFNTIYPLTHGGAVAQYYFLEQLSQIHDITLFVIPGNERQNRELKELNTLLPKLTYLYYEPINKQSKPWYYPIYSMYVKLKKATKPKLKTKNNDENRETYTAKQIHPDLIRFIDEHIQKTHYDFIQLEFFDTLTFLDIFPNSVPTIFIHHEIAYKRSERENKYGRNYLTSLKAYELKQLKKASAVVVFNDDDLREIRQVNSNVFVSPFGIPNKMISDRAVSETYNKLLFIGSELNAPNKQGLTWFLDKLYVPAHKTFWPIYITGKWSDEFKSKYKSIDNIIFTGFVDDLCTLYDNAVLISPIVSGSGIRTKILQSFANKIPVFATPLAAEGLYHTEDPKHLVLFSNHDKFRAALNKAITEPNWLIQVALNGYNYYNQNYNSNLLVDIRLKAYESLTSIQSPTL